MRIVMLTVLIIAILLMTTCFPLFYLSDALLRQPGTEETALIPEASSKPVPAPENQGKQQPMPEPVPEETPDWMREEPLYYRHASAGEEYLKNGQWTEAAFAYEAAIEYAIEEGCSKQGLAGLYLSLMRAYDMQGKRTRSLSVLLGAKEQGAQSREIDEQIAYKLSDFEVDAGVKEAYRGALQSLLDQYGQYICTEDDWEYPLGVFHADILDCDRDGTHELFCIYGVPGKYTYAYGGATYEDVCNIPCIELYTYRDGRAVRLLRERVGNYFAQSDEGKEVVLGGTNEVWLNFYLDTQDYCKAYYTVQNGNLVSRVLNAALPRDTSFDIDVSLYDVALGYEIDGQQVDRNTFEEESVRLSDMIYGPDGEPAEYIFIPPDTFRARGYAKQIEAVMLLLGG